MKQAAHISADRETVIPSVEVIRDRRTQESTKGLLYRRDATGAGPGICVRGRPPTFPSFSPSLLSSFPFPLSPHLPLPALILPWP